MVIYSKNEKMKTHTLLVDVLPTLEDYHIPLTWMLTDLECNYLPEILRADEPIILSGDELDLLIRNKPDLQIIWGVLSGFRLPRPEIDFSILPKAEDPEVWKECYQIQHPQAECELVGWDSSATFFRSKNQKVMDIFSRMFPEAQTLELFNRNRSSKTI